MNNKVLKFQSKIKSGGLLLAADKRHKEIVEDLINAGEDINCSHCQTNYTVLHYASENGWLDIVKSLLEKGADIQVKTKYGDSPLILAAKYINMDISEFLLDAGADINYSNSQNNDTVLHYTIKNGWTKIVQILLKKGVDFEAKTKYGEPPLLLAAAEKQKGIVELLVNAGADINCFESYTKNNTLLHYASRNGWFKMVQFLLKKGTDVEAKNERGESALAIAAQRGHLDIFEFLLNAGADINLRKNKPNNNYTILHYASERGLFEIAQILLKRGLDIEGNSIYTPPLVLAAGNGQKDIVKLLVSAGADIHCFERCNIDNTLLHYAAQWGWFEIIQFLLKKGTDIEVKNKSGMSPLFIAAQYKHRDIVELLLNAGADINCTFSSFTVLHFVARAGWLNILQFLLQKGVNVDAKSSSGKTSLQMACEYSNFEIVEHLKNAGADVNMETNYGTSPLSTIIENFCGITLGIPYYIKILPNFKLVCSSLITSGAYLKSVDYERIMKHLYLKEYILQDIELSSQAIINEFNYKDLPELYKHSIAFKILPRIENMRIWNNSQVAHEVLQSVKHEIHVNGYCNVMAVRPIVLKMLAVKSFLNYCENIKKQGSVSNQRKRSAELDYDNQHTKSSHKMMRLN